METERVDTSGENWMEPFSLALGLQSDEFKPWKQLLLAPADSILLVEGDTDKAYFEMLRDEGHGANRLAFDGEIVSYGGTGSLANTILLRFIKNRYKKLFVTYDLDSQGKVAKTLSSLGLERKKHHLPIGTNAPGKRDIEGLLPPDVTTAVHAANPDLVQAAIQGNKDERESAKNNLKALKLAEFQKKATPGAEYYSSFYPLVKAINKALC